MSMFTYILCLLLLAGRPAHQSPTAEADADCGRVERSNAQEVVELKSEQRARTLAGVVASPSGPMIPDVTVEIVDSREHCLRTAMTDGEGRFDFKTGKPGRYRLRLSKPGFNTVVATVRVSRYTKSELRVELPMSN
jgi:Carboxypeptidase regulatory-like domain